MRSDFTSHPPDFQYPRGGFSNARDMTDPELVQQSLAVLRAYLAQTGAQTAGAANRAHAELSAGRKRRGDGSGNGRLRMSTEEALDILGLEPTATAKEIRDAYCRLEQKVDPELGGTHYLMAKIIEARDVLLLSIGCGRFEGSGVGDAKSKDWHQFQIRWCPFVRIFKSLATFRESSRSKMAHRRHDLWLLIRLAAQNVGRRRLRAVFLSARRDARRRHRFRQLCRWLGIARRHDDQLFRMGAGSSWSFHARRW
jgi:hypothetical protein